MLRHITFISRCWNTVFNASNYVAWGEATSGDLVLEPVTVQLDNFGGKLCLIHDSAVFEWDSSLSNATDTKQQLYLVHQQRHVTC